MKIEFDPTKSARNAERRGFAFDLVRFFDFDTAVIVEDSRRDYGETRYRATGRLQNRLMMVVFTMRGSAVRVISLRLANRKERSLYDRQEENRSRRG